MPDIKDMEGPVKFKKGVELYFDPEKDMFYDPKKKKYMSEKDILALEDVDFDELETIEEGVYDPSIFKAIFMAGGPGSGKSYVSNKVTAGLGMKVVNSDDIFEIFLKKAGMTTTAKDIFSDKGQEIRGNAKNVTSKRMKLYLEGRLGLLIDGTGKDYANIKKKADRLRDLGYDTYMVFVNTSLEIAQERNAARSRKLDPKEVEKMWRAVQENIGKFQKYFGARNMIIVDNNAADEKYLTDVYKQVKKLIKKPAQNRLARDWISKALDDKVRKEEVELTEKIICGCDSDCEHCEGKHSESEVGKECKCCGNEIIKEAHCDSKKKKMEEDRDEEYEKFFQSALKKFGVSSPSELKGDKKKEFFDYVDKNWEGENEEDEEETIEELSLEEAIAEAKEWKVGAPVYIVISYHTNGKHSTTVIRKKEKAMKFAKDEEYHEDDVKGTVVLDMKVGKFINKDTGEYIKEESIEERYDRKTTLKVHKAMMKKYGNDPYYKQVIDALLSKGTDKMEKAIKSLVAIRGDQALKNLQRDMKSMLGEELKIEEAISEKLGPVIVISYNTNGKPYTTVIRKEENIEESRIRLSSLMNGGALIYDRDEDPDDDKLATVKVKGNPKKDIKNGDDLVLSLMGKGKSKEKEILKSLKKYYPKSKVVKEETELSEKMQNYVDACGKDFTTYTYSLKEGKKDYEIHHKTFTSAVEEVEKFAEKNGYEIDSDEMFNKVGSGPKKPSVGKTNEYHLTLMKNGKEDKKKLHFQVYGMKTQYELTMYIS